MQNIYFQSNWQYNHSYGLSFFVSSFLRLHYMKSVHIRSFSGPYFPAFGLPQTPNMDTFHPMVHEHWNPSCSLLKKSLETRALHLRLTIFSSGVKKVIRFFFLISIFNTSFVALNFPCHFRLVTLHKILFYHNLLNTLRRTKNIF